MMESTPSECKCDMMHVPNQNMVITLKGTQILKESMVINLKVLKYLMRT